MIPGRGKSFISARLRGGRDRGYARPLIMNANPPQPDRTDPVVKFRWPLVVIALGFLAVFAFLASLWILKRTYDETLDRGGKTADYVATKAQAIAAKFSQGTITTTFLAALPEIVSSGSGNLELATADQVETFRVEDERRVLWETLNLGKTVSEIRVPVTYRYHLRLAEPWKLDVSGQTCVVVAPAIRPSLPPAIHTDRLEKKSEAGWGRFNALEQMDALEKSVTPTLSKYAADARRMALVREQSRKTVAEFVKAWLLKEDQWRNDRFHTIKVVFADESGVTPDSATPTIQMH